MARGGYRPNSGPKKGTKYKKRTTAAVKTPKIPQDIIDEAKAEDLEPLEYMLKVMNDPKAAEDRRDRMAIASAPFVHSRKGEGQGKKEDRDEKAKQAGAGKFQSGRPPLKVVK